MGEGGMSADGTVLASTTGSLVGLLAGGRVGRAWPVGN